MKICGACYGKGEVNYDICEVCGGEGIDTFSTFTVGKINRRKALSYEEAQSKKEKQMKFDKKNASRGGL